MTPQLIYANEALLSNSDISLETPVSHRMQTQQHSAKVLLRRIIQDQPLSTLEINVFGIGTEEQIRNFWYCHHLFSLCKSSLLDAELFEQPVIDPAPMHAAKKVKANTPKMSFLTPSASTDFSTMNAPIEKIKTFTCTQDYCGRVYQTICALKYHQKTGHGRREAKTLVAYECKKCDSHFSTKKQLFMHEKDVHPAPPHNSKAGTSARRSAPIEDADVFDYYLV